MDELLDNAPCGFLVFADDGVIVEANATLLDLLGCERGDLVGLHIEKIFSVAGRIFYQTHFFPLLKLRGKVEEVYLALRSKAGEEIPVLANARRRERAAGENFNDCVFVAMRQRNQYEEAILRAKKEAETATRAKDEFLSVVSHELRTPLNSILGWAQMLHSRKLDPETVDHAVEAILRSARSQTRLIEDLLDFARIISGKLRLEVERVDLGKVIEAAVDVVIPAAQAKKIDLLVLPDPGDFVSGSGARLQQALWNLLSNAIKFTPEGGRVRVELKRAGSNVEISVGDDGKGIDPEFLPFVFDRFQQADNTIARRYGGLGLGLAITRHIVELHGGTIRAESEGENLGAIFTISLPATTSHGREIAAAAAPGPDDERRSSNDETGALSGDAPRLDGLHALVVDDETETREILTVILTHQGAKVTTAATVAEAVEKLHSIEPDFVISDIEMPGTADGFPLIKKLRAFNRKRARKIPAVALTAHAGPSEKMKILSAGYQIHLSKPIEPAELLAVIANLVRQVPAAERGREN